MITYFVSRVIVALTFCVLASYIVASVMYCLSAT